VTRTKWTGIKFRTKRGTKKRKCVRGGPPCQAHKRKRSTKPHHPHKMGTLPKWKKNPSGGKTTKAVLATGGRGMA